MCTLCSEGGTDFNTVDAHVAANHLGFDPENHKCVCGMTCANDVSLAHHFRGTHVNIVYMCDSCRIRFNEMSQLHQHFLINPSHRHLRGGRSKALCLPVCRSTK